MPADPSNAAAGQFALPPAQAASAETQPLIYTPRRRLGALEAAAATAVIVACVVALASMTGLLPASMQVDAAHRTAGTAVATPAETALTAPGMATANAAAMRATAATPLHQVARPGTGTPAATSAAMSATTSAATSAARATADAQSSAVATPAGAPGTPGAPENLVAAAPSQVPVATVSPGRRHHAHGRSARVAEGRFSASAQGGIARNSAGKTREQVISELMQSKRDGTYPAQSETYR